MPSATARPALDVAGALVVGAVLLVLLMALGLGVGIAVGIGTDTRTALDAGVG